MILRFVLVYELFWKTLRRFLAYEKIETSYPKQVLKTAYQIHWLESEEVWLNMIEDRNLVAHTYDQERAREIYRRIQGYLSELQRTYDFLQQKTVDILNQ